MSSLRFVVDVEVHDQPDSWAQARYLVHGTDDVLWTNDVDSALEYIRECITERNKE